MESLMSTPTEPHSQAGLKKRRKREADRRYRQNKKVAVHETESKLAMTIIENENLRQEIFHLTRERELIQQRFEAIYAELQQEIGIVSG